MPLIPLDLLKPHPDNANVMPEPALAKLTTHIAETGRYPPLIVRPGIARHEYQIIDGHHRAAALKRIGFTHALCEVWDVDDERASVLLLSLNRLRGEDEPRKRGQLLVKLGQSMQLEGLAARLPESRNRIAKLMELATPPQAPPAAPQPLSDMPHAVTFFLTGAQRSALLRKLAAVCRDRSEALAQVLSLDVHNEPADDTMETMKQ